MDSEMSVLKRIRRYIFEFGEHPWPLGCKANELSKESLIAWRMLSIEERIGISRNNPFITERNECLRGLRLRGYSQSILSEFSGLAPVTIKRLSLKKKAKHE